MNFDKTKSNVGAWMRFSAINAYFIRLGRCAPKGSFVTDCFIEAFSLSLSPYHSLSLCVCLFARWRKATPTKLAKSEIPQKPKDENHCMNYSYPICNIMQMVDTQRNTATLPTNCGSNVGFSFRCAAHSAQGLYIYTYISLSQLLHWIQVYLTFKAHAYPQHTVTVLLACSAITMEISSHSRWIKYTNLFSNIYSLMDFRIIMKMLTFI